MLALVRHGESTWIAEGRFQGQADPPLTTRGRRQAEALAGRLADPTASPRLPVPYGPPVAVWHSPLRRSADTAQAMSEAWTRAELRPLPELSELAQGEWEGLTHDEVRQRYGRELDGWRRDPLHHHAPGGESLLQALERARRARRIIWAHMAVAGTVTGASGRSGDGPSEPAEPAEPVLGYERGRSRSLASAVASTPWALVVAHDGILRLLLLDALDLPVSAYWSVPFQLASVTVLDVSSDLVRLRGHNIAEGFLGADPAPRR